MGDKIEVDRADLEAVSRWWSGVGYDDCATAAIKRIRAIAAIKRIRQLLEPSHCGWQMVTIVFGSEVVLATCVLPYDHDGDHATDRASWRSPR